MPGRTVSQSLETKGWAVTMSHEPPQTSSEFDRRVDRFDSAWHRGLVPKIDEFLPPPDPTLLDWQQRCRLVER